MYGKNISKVLYYVQSTSKFLYATAFPGEFKDSVAVGKSCVLISVIGKQVSFW